MFGVDGDTMESVVAAALPPRGWTIGFAESVSGGMLASRFTDVAGVSEVFRGLDRRLRQRGEVRPARRPRGAGGVAPRRPRPWPPGPGGCSAPTSASPSPASPGPAEQEGQAVGTVFVGLAIGEEAPTSVLLRLPGVRRTVRELAVISALDVLRRRGRLASDELRATSACGCSSPPMPDRVRRAVAAVDRPPGDDVRWADPSSWHVTLRFLGELDDASGGRGREALAAVVRRCHRGRRADVPAPGADRRRAPGRGLAEVAAAVATAFAALPGEERRPFSGHLTLGRLRRPGRWPRAGVGTLDAELTWPVEEIVLVRSHLGGGARPLRGAARC